MGGSSPHCAGRDEFRIDFSSRGYASKRVAQSGARNGHIPHQGPNARFKGSRGDCFPLKGKVLASRILVAAVLVWLMFQGTLLLQGKNSEIDLAVTLPWNDGLHQMKQSLINSSLVSKLREPSVRIERKDKSWPTLRPPKLALVYPHVGVSPDTVFFITLAKGLRYLGYQLDLYAMKDGSLRGLWSKLNVSVTILEPESAVDWSMYDGIVALSLYSRYAFSSLVVEPFRSIPLVWIIQDNQSVKVLDETIGRSKTTWKRAFERANVVTFPNNMLLDSCNPFDTGNFRIVPGSPVEVWEAEQYMASNNRQSIRVRYGLENHDFGIAVGSLSPSGIWKAHAMVMHAVAQMPTVRTAGNVKLLVLGHGLSGNYSIALAAMASQFGLLNDSIQYVGEEHADEVLWAADVFVYVSVSEESLFPSLLIRAMAFGQRVVAPATSLTEKHISEGVSGYLYPREDYGVLADRLFKLRLSKSSTRVATAARLTARNLLASEAVSEYAEVLQTTVEFPSEVSVPDISRLPKFEWAWSIVDGKSAIEEFQLDRVNRPGSSQNVSTIESTPEVDNEDYESILEYEVSQEKALQLIEDVERVEDEELDERKEQMQAAFEDVNRGVKRAEREKFEFHERDDGELERTGQPLCIYEPYYGTGAWPFLHQDYPLYRGLSLSPKGRRPRVDDVDAAVRLTLLNDTYYRDNLCEFGAFLAIANRIDRVHKNSWIGFQPWSAAARKVALSQRAEASLVDAVKVGSHGDAVYFWGRLDGDTDDFWTACDAKNAGNCSRIFLETFKEMYGLGDVAVELPAMPAGAWAGRHSWVMSTASYMEFVLFSRIFLDALDSRLYVEHHDYGKCPLATTKYETQHCYCRLLETLVNVWAYHSARKMVYVDPQTGFMTEQHPLDGRRGVMKVKWFSFNVLKGMDEDMAERADVDHPNQRWLWPHTGEVFWQGILDRERQERYNLKMEKKRRNKERLARMRSRYKQKTIGRYVKPPPDDEALNTTATVR